MTATITICDVIKQTYILSRQCMYRRLTTRSIHDANWLVSAALVQQLTAREDIRYYRHTCVTLKHFVPRRINLLKSIGYVMHQQFNIQQLYALPTLYLCVLYLSENKQRLVPLTA